MQKVHFGSCQQVILPRNIGFQSCQLMLLQIADSEELYKFGCSHIATDCLTVSDEFATIPSLPVNPGELPRPVWNQLPTSPLETAPIHIIATRRNNENKTETNNYHLAVFLKHYM
jgi:hypothetical protein